ncbi:MAG TPA: hypothetical protein VHF01_17890 [Candidatus Acidoferrum sp.]|nr:hypothetical protein [Candidatus Acidoferrum sp.]
MARHKLTLRERIKGIESAMRSPHVPKQLVPGLRRYARKLRKKLRK